MKILLFFFSLLGIGRLEAAEPVLPQLDERQLISFYRGQLLWQEFLQQPGMSYDLEQVIAGIRAAENGKKIPCDEGTLLSIIRRFQEEVLEKQTKENLADAEAFLAKIAKEDAIELIPNKLYYKRVKKGTGKVVQPHHTPLLTYSLSTYNRWEKSHIISIDEPSAIALEETIPGFAKGISGMLEGEIRELFIHPELAYGTYGKLDPNLLVISKIEIIRADSKEDSSSNHKD